MNKELEEDKQYFRKLSDTWKTMGNINEKASERLDNLLQYIEELENKVEDRERLIDMLSKSDTENIKLQKEVEEQKNDKYWKRMGTKTK